MATPLVYPRGTSQHGCYEPRLNEWSHAPAGCAYYKLFMQALIAMLDSTHQIIGPRFARTRWVNPGYYVR
jgi:hypothetical protein